MKTKQNIQLLHYKNDFGSMYVSQLDWLLQFWKAFAIYVFALRSLNGLRMPSKVFNYGKQLS